MCWRNKCAGERILLRRTQRRTHPNGTASQFSPMTNLNGGMALSDSWIHFRGSADNAHYMAYIGGGIDGVKLVGNAGVVIATNGSGDRLLCNSGGVTYCGTLTNGSDRRIRTTSPVWIWTTVAPSSSRPIQSVHLQKVTACRHMGLSRRRSETRFTDLVRRRRTRIWTSRTMAPALSGNGPHHVVDVDCAHPHQWSSPCWSRTPRSSSRWKTSKHK